MTHVLDAQGRIKRGPSNLDARYLRLDCVNDPLTAGLEINAATAGEPVLILQTTDDDATNPFIDLQNSGTPMPFVIQKDGSRFFHTYGTSNLFIGPSAGNFTLTQFRNIGIGDDTLLSLTSGARNLCIGAFAGTLITTGTANVCLGAVAGNALTTGSDNVFIGSNAGMVQQTAADNVFIGTSSGLACTTGELNVGLGKATLTSLTTGVGNFALGGNAGFSLLTGTDNVLVGVASGRNLLGSENIFIGRWTGKNTTTADHNIAIGWLAGQNIGTGDDNIVIGYNINTTAANVSHELNIGGLIYGALDTNRGGVNVTPPNLAAAWHVDQATDDAAIPALLLDQADVSEEMIEFISTIGVGNAIEAVDGKTLTTTHFIKVTLPGPLTVYLPVGTIA